MKRLVAIVLVALFAGGGLAACGKKARLRTPTDERARQAKEDRAEQIEEFSDERYEERAREDEEPNEDGGP